MCAHTLVASRKLGNETIVRTISARHLSLHDAYVFGYCLSQSSCQWKVELPGAGSEHVKMMKRAIDPWGPSKSKTVKCLELWSSH